MSKEPIFVGDIFGDLVGGYLPPEVLLKDIAPDDIEDINKAIETLKWYIDILVKNNKVELA